MFTTYSGGAQTNTVTKLLPFDATAGFHDYVIEYDTASVRFLVDGTLMQSWTKGVTRSAMYLYVNAWFPSWLAGERPATDRLTLVDSDRASRPVADTAGWKPATSPPALDPWPCV